jgi:DnaJ-class molecular chaperone
VNSKDYYEILGIERDVPLKNIKEAYRRLAFQFHPDRNSGDAESVERMKEINEAYAVLSDPQKRARYDRLRSEFGASAQDRFRQDYSEQDIFRGSDINQIFEEMARTFGFRGFEEIFRQSYGQGYRTFEFRSPGVFGRGFVFTGFPRGDSNRLGSAPSQPLFPGFLGKIAGYMLRRILGAGNPEKGGDFHDTLRIDTATAHQGAKVRYTHPDGFRELMVTIPPGVRDGQKMRLRGMGYEGKGGAEAGDLYLKIRIGKPLLQRFENALRQALNSKS